MIPSGHTAVMAQRREPPNSLVFFPTPPWATRGLTRPTDYARFAAPAEVPLLAALDVA